MKTPQTTDYSKFKIVKSNRLIDERHLKRLMASIKEKNLLSVNPIVVNKDMEIIDGQHRYYAAKKLKLPIFYILHEAIQEEDISRLNSIKKDWKPLDYINYYRTKKRAGFDVVWKYYQAYPEYGITNILKLLAKEGKKNISGELREGDVDVSNQKAADEILKILSSFDEYPFYKTNKFVYAIAKCYGTGKYDHSVMMSQLAKQRRSFVQCVNIEQYIDMIEEIYNYRLSANRVTFKSK